MATTLLLLIFQINVESRGIVMMIETQTLLRERLSLVMPGREGDITEQAVAAAR